MIIDPKGGTRTGWKFTYEHVFSPRVTIKPGSKIRIRGERGWFTFIRIVTNLNGVKWVDVIDKDYRFRSFYLDRIKGVPPKRRSGVKKHDER